MPLRREHLGQRVVVRRVLPGELGRSGGPAMTDVLGTLVTFDDNSIAVQREDGERTVISHADIVAGKPVPPRPVARMRITSEELQRIAAAGWVAPHQRSLGDWLLRATAGFTGRANSALPVGDPHMPLDDALAEVEAFYAAQRLPALVQVVEGSPRWDELHGRGWVDARPGAASAPVQVASVARARRAVASPLRADAVEIRATPDDEWTRVYARTIGLDGDVVRAVLTSGDEVGFARLGSPVVAVGRAVVTGDWLGLYAVEVLPANRRSGLGTAIVSALLAWGAQRGTLSAYLQTLDDNVAALAMYGRFGFETHHTYRYLRPGDGWVSARQRQTMGASGE